MIIKEFIVEILFYLEKKKCSLRNPSSIKVIDCQLKWFPSLE